jgi:hypothetical protein
VQVLVCTGGTADRRLCTSESLEGVVVGGFWGAVAGFVGEFLG